jgi:splicing factor 3B subunit 5
VAEEQQQQRRVYLGWRLCLFEAEKRIGPFKLDIGLKRWGFCCFPAEFDLYFHLLSLSLLLLLLPSFHSFVTQGIYHIMADKLKEQQVYTQLKSKHIGLGDADTTKHEFMTNVFRDSYSSVVGHPALLEYVSLSHEVPRQLLKHQLIEKMVRPCGPRPTSDTS